jgi:hypothetical protein
MAAWKVGIAMIGGREHAVCDQNVVVQATVE